MDVSEAEKLLREERTVRLQQCSEEISKILAHYRCQLKPRITITPEGTEFSFDLYTE